MENGKPPIFVANTFIKVKDMQPYIFMAHLMDYEVEEVVCKGEYENIHGVPPKVVASLKQQFETWNPQPETPTLTSPDIWRILWVKELIDTSEWRYIACPKCV